MGASFSEVGKRQQCFGTAAGIRSASLADRRCRSSEAVTGPTVFPVYPLAPTFQLAFDPAVDSYLNPAAFAQPALYTFGTASVTEPNLRSFPIYNENFSLIKRSYIKEKINLEFRAEFFNLFNRVTFAAPSTNFDALNTFGFVFGQANTPGNIQFGLKVNF